MPDLTKYVELNSDFINEYKSKDIILSNQYRFMRIGSGIDGLYQMLIDLDKKIDLKNLTMVEIGSFTGESSELFCQFFKKVYCVDIWDRNFFGLDENDIGPEDHFNHRIMKNFNNIEKIKDTSENASKLFDNRFLDMVYIDGSHEYNDVKNDIISWYPKIKKNGIISGHDYTNLPQHEGVLNAINEILGIPEFTFEDGSFYFIKKNRGI